MSSTKTNTSKTSSCLLIPPGIAFGGTLARRFGTTFGQNLSPMKPPTSMKRTPMMGLITTVIRLNSPDVVANKTLKATSDRTSSTNAAVMTACPKSFCSCLASINNFNATTGLVGVRATPTARPSGKMGSPKNHVMNMPATIGKTVPTTATKHAPSPTLAPFSKSKCMPLSNTIKLTPACPTIVNTLGSSVQAWLISASHSVSAHSTSELKVLHISASLSRTISRRQGSILRPWTL
mmetsp:Transcript_35958/g.66048  ORF Transcript_35958/g.66048 Transcript_35958/m.66048 type:complete len:236 (+) Transcript_35958:2323-3030(+)